jgi:hypothetical protein
MIHFFGRDPPEVKKCLGDASFSRFFKAEGMRSDTTMEISKTKLSMFCLKDNSLFKTISH